MPFTDRNHILLKLGVLALLGFLVFGTSPQPTKDCVNLDMQSPTYVDDQTDCYFAQPAVND